jgi:TPR repeat protein
MSGCHAAALDHYYSPASPEHDAAAVSFFKKGCDGGYAPSCNGLGVMYAEGRGVSKDDVAAVKLFRSSCAADASTGCEHFASSLDAGRGVAKDPALAELARARGRCVFEASLHPDAGACAPLPN